MDLNYTRDSSMSGYVWLKSLYNIWTIKIKSIMISE